MCFTSWCHWENSSLSKDCAIYLCTSVSPSGCCTLKHHVWKHKMHKTVITKFSIICSESSGKWRVDYSLNPSLCCGLYSLLRFLMDNLAMTINPTGSFLIMPISTMLTWIWADNEVTRWSSMTSATSLASEYKIIVLTNTGPLASVAAILIWHPWFNIWVSFSEYSLVDESHGSSSVVIRILQISLFSYSATLGEYTSK